MEQPLKKGVNSETYQTPSQAHAEIINTDATDKGCHRKSRTHVCVPCALPARHAAKHWGISPLPKAARVCGTAPAGSGAALQCCGAVDTRRAALYASEATIPACMGQSPAIHFLPAAFLAEAVCLPAASFFSTSCSHTHILHNSAPTQHPHMPYRHPHPAA